MSAFLLLLLFTIVFSLVAAVFYEEHRAYRYAPGKVRTYLTGAGVTIIEPKDDERIVGDVIAAQWPRHVSAREYEPMGM